MIIAMVAVVISCSKDDEPAPNVENAKLSFSGSQQILEVPQGLLDSDDPNAQMAAAWVGMANMLAGNIAMFEFPAGAAKTSDLITPVNGRTTAEQGLVYIWSDGASGSVAYQVRESGNKYIFELFFKGTEGLEGDGWYRYLYAEERKDGSEGYMVVTDIWGALGDSRSAELLRWEWSRKGDIFTFSMSSESDDFNFTVEVNTSTKAGSIVYFYGGIKQSEVEWNAAGAGSWKQFDDAGEEVIDQGTWS